MDGERGRVAIYRDPAGLHWMVAEFEVPCLAEVGKAREAYHLGIRAAVHLQDVPDAELRDVVDYLNGLVRSTGGEMWEVMDSVLMLTPPEAAPPMMDVGLLDDEPAGHSDAPVGTHDDTGGGSSWWQVVAYLGDD